MTVRLHTWAERPDLAERGPASEDVWPEYNLYGDVLGAWWGALLDELPEFQFALYDEDADAVLAEGHTGRSRGTATTRRCRTAGVDPFGRGYVSQWAPRDLMAVGPLHGTHEPPFYVCGSDHWVAGYMEGAVRTGRAAAAAALGRGLPQRADLVA
jgi:hypothetical protein